MRIATVVGARPQFIKSAPVSRALKAAGISERVIDTGQHYDANMSAVFFEELGLSPPAHSLGIGSGPHGAMTGRMLEAVEAVLSSERPDAVLVFGDTNTTLAGALAAAKMSIPVVHVEAGLRSFRRDMPEEINRTLVDHMSKILFCPSTTAVENLRREGIASDTDPLRRHVLDVGDVMVDALRLFAGKTSTHPRVASLDARPYVLATLHRAESTDDADALEHVTKELCALAASVPVLLPLHPRTRAALDKLGLLGGMLSRSNLHCVEPLGYRDFTAAMARAVAVVTDSGGVQKEAMILGVPCVTLRDETEWPETVSLGWNVLAGRRPVSLPEFVMGRAAPTGGSADVYGDGHAAERIATALVELGPCLA